MASSSKPDLVVHPALFAEFQRHDLDAEFNVLEDLTVVRDPPCLLISGPQQIQHMQLVLEPHHDVGPQEDGVSSSPESTSYKLVRATRLYGVEQRGPRYVVWLTDEPLDVCGTCVDRIRSIDETPEAVARARSWAYRIERQLSVIVFDLDGTLIDKSERGRKLKFADEALRHARDTFDRVVLWSHGSALHVDEHATRFRRTYEKTCPSSGRDLFDLVLSQPLDVCDFRCSCKNLLHLYNFMPRDCSFGYAVLVEDSPGNWTPEYSRLVIPGCRDLTMLADCLIE